MTIQEFLEPVKRIFEDTIQEITQKNPKVKITDYSELPEVTPELLDEIRSKTSISSEKMYDKKNDGYSPPILKKGLTY